MNYNDALNVSITDKLTKSKLIEVANTLQDQCLVYELEEPPAFDLIFKGLNLLYKQLKYEIPLLIKDIIYLGSNTKRLIVNAMNSKNF